MASIGSRRYRTSPSISAAHPAKSAPRQSPDRARGWQSARTTPGCYRRLTGPVNTPADRTRLPLSRSRSSHTVLPNAAGPTLPSLLPSSQTHGTLAPAREAGAVCGLEMAPFPYKNSYFIEACDALISIKPSDDDLCRAFASASKRFERRSNWTWVTASPEVPAITRHCSALARSCVWVRLDGSGWSLT